MGRTADSASSNQRFCTGGSQAASAKEAAVWRPWAVLARVAGGWCQAGAAKEAAVWRARAVLARVVAGGWCQAGTAKEAAVWRAWAGADLARVVRCIGLE